MKTETVVYKRKDGTESEAHKRIIWEAGDIGYVMGVTKAKVLSINKSLFSE